MDALETAEHVDSLTEPQLRSMILDFEKEKQRRQDRIDREHERLKALNSELAMRKEEYDRYRREVQRLLSEFQEREETEARTKTNKKDDFLSRLARDNVDAKREVADKVRSSVESQLEESLRRGKTSRKNELGIRIFDEMELMVDKPPAEQAKEGKTIDTVMVVFAQNSEARSYLSYRVDASKCAHELLEDACLYWGLSEVEYVLKTQQGSKIHDFMKIQNCFRPDEQALLTLMQKNPKQTRLLPEEMDSIKSSKGKKAKRPEAGKPKGDEVSAQADREEEDEELEQQMITKKVYGLWEFLTQWCDQEVVGHLKSFSLSNVLVYFVMGAVLIWNLGLVLEPHRGFFCRDGVLMAMASERVVVLGDGALVHVQAFPDIRSKDAAWTWLTYVVSEVLLDDNSDLRKSNYLPGQVQLRVQMVQEKSHDQCSHKDDLSDSITCAAHYYDSNSAYKATFSDLDAYWSNLSGVAGRADINPAQYEPEAPGDTATIEGFQQSYDKSGYVVGYNLQSSPLSEMRQAYLADMEELKSSWLNDRTRAIHVSFLLYNGNYDYWVSNHFLLEMPANGIVVPYADPLVFKPITTEYGDEGAIGLSVFVLDTGLLIIAVLYVGVWQFRHHSHVNHRYNKELRAECADYQKVMNERGLREGKEPLPPEICKFKPGWFKLEEKKTERRTLGTFLKGNTVIDTLGITVSFIAVYSMRYVVPWAMYGNSPGYRKLAKQGLVNSEADATMFSWSVILQSIVISCVLWRWYGFLKVNRFVFLIFKTISTATVTFSKFGLILLPVMVSFVFFAHQIWRPYASEYKTFWSSFAAFLVRLVGDKESAKMADPERSVTVFFSVSSFFVVKLVLIQSWIASLVQTYQRVRVTSGYKPDEKDGPYHWKEEDYVDHLLWPWAARLYRKFRRLDIKQD